MRKEQVIEEALATEKPGLREWKFAEDERIDAAVREQIDILDRGAMEKLIHAQSDAYVVGEDSFTRDGIIRALGELRLDHAMGIVQAEQDPGEDPDHRGRGPTEVKATPHRYRKQRDLTVRFNDEIEALRYWWSAGAETRSGDFDRIAQRVALGATIQSSTRNSEPRSDAYIEVINRAMKSVDDWKIIEWAHLEFARTPQRTAGTDGCTHVPDFVASELLRYDDGKRQTGQTDAQARERMDAYHRWVKAGRRPSENMVAIPPNTPIEASKGVQSAHAIAKSGRPPEWSKLSPAPDAPLRWEHLVAERLEMNISGALGPLDPRKIERGPKPGEDEAEFDNRMTHLEASAREVRARYQAARKKFREELQRVWLDFSGTSLQKGGGSAKYIIPAPTSRELDADAKDGSSGDVECCIGVRVANGVRMPCDAVYVEGPKTRHPAKGWRRCDVCGKPVVEGMVAA